MKFVNTYPKNGLDDGVAYSDNVLRPFLKNQLKGEIEDGDVDDAAWSAEAAAKLNNYKVHHYFQISTDGQGVEPVITDPRIWAKAFIVELDNWSPDLPFNCEDLLSMVNECTKDPHDHKITSSLVNMDRHPNDSILASSEQFDDSSDLTHTEQHIIHMLSKLFHIDVKKLKRSDMDVYAHAE